VDDFTRECVAIAVDRSLPGLRVTRVLDRLRTTIGLPETIERSPLLNQRIPRRIGVLDSPRLQACRQEKQRGDVCVVSLWCC
jgi:hypothetical protein